MRPQLFTKECRQVREKKQEEIANVRARRRRDRVKSMGKEIKLPISCHRQAAVLTMAVDSQLPLAATHSVRIVNKQFKGKCQPQDGRSSSGFNISSPPLPPNVRRPICQASDGHGG